jgi:hypothetical protein
MLIFAIVKNVTWPLAPDGAWKSLQIPTGYKSFHCWSRFVSSTPAYFW